MNNPPDSAPQELKPCPFCGEPATIRLRDNSRTVDVYCAYRACPVEPHVQSATESQSISAWNTRAPQAPQKDEAATPAKEFQKGGDANCIANTGSSGANAQHAKANSTLAIASNAEPKSNPSVSASPAPEPKCPTCGCAHIIEIEHADGTFTCVMGHEFSASPAPSPLLAPIVERAKNTVAYWKEMADIERGEREIMERERDAARAKLERALKTLKRIGCNQSRYYGSEAMNLYNELK